MKIAFLLGEFPAISQTFVLDQITGLIDRGHEVDIYAYRLNGEGVQHAAVQRYDLTKRAHTWPTLPESRVLRLGDGLRPL